jgi:hypothetical protein
MQILKGRLREALGNALTRCHLPGALQEARVHDPLTGTELTVHIGALYTVVTVNGRDFYFDRVTGSYSGTGSAL